MKLTLIVYLLPMLLLVAWNLRRRQQQHAAGLAALDENRKAGLTEPASLHPLIDPHRCMGCGSCVSACPEGDVLGRSLASSQTATFSV